MKVVASILGALGRALSSKLCRSKDRFSPEEYYGQLLKKASNQLYQEIVDDLLDKIDKYDDKRGEK